LLLDQLISMMHKDKQQKMQEQLLA